MLLILKIYTLDNFLSLLFLENGAHGAKLKAKGDRCHKLQSSTDRNKCNVGINHSIMILFLDVGSYPCMRIMPWLPDRRN